MTLVHACTVLTKCGPRCCPRCRIWLKVTISSRPANPVQWGLKKKKKSIEKAEKINNDHFPSIFRFKDSNVPFDKYPYHTYYGDGSEIEPVVLENIRAVTWSCAVGFRWRTGDVLVIDNLAVQHARMSFTGQRKILAVLSRNWVHYHHITY